MMKKLVALILAVVMVMAMGSVAFADSTTDSKGSVPSNVAIKTNINSTVTLNKTLIVFNPENVGVYEPNIQYTYTVTPVTIDATNTATVTDVNNVTVHVKSGVNGGLTFTSAEAFADTNAKVSATADGTLVEHNIELSVNNSVFDTAGIYRYKLTDTTDVSALNAVGITRPADYKVDRYIDLYVKNNATGTGREVYSAVVFTTTSVSDPTKDAITTETIKTTGYNESTQSDNNYTDDTVADHYYTYNLKVEKETTGNLADKSHQFPFAVNISGIKAAKITYAGVGVDAANAADETVTSNTVNKGELTESSALKLKSGESVTFYGIPFGASATVSEYNDTVDEYKALKDVTKTTNASTEVKLNSDVTLTPKTATAKAELANILIDAGTAHTATDTTQKSTATTVAHFTNDLAQISETGVVMRVAPYVLILATGMVLVLISRRRKAAEEE